MFGRNCGGLNIYYLFIAGLINFWEYTHWKTSYDYRSIKLLLRRDRQQSRIAKEKVSANKFDYVGKNQSYKIRVRIVNY